MEEINPEASVERTILAGKNLQFTILVMNDGSYRLLHPFLPTCFITGKINGSKNDAEIARTALEKFCSAGAEFYFSDGSEASI